MAGGVQGDGGYAAAIYFAGVSIECLLRAFITREDPHFDQRHHLQAMYKKSQLEEFIRPSDRRQVGAWLGEVWVRWKNNYRFASDDRLRSELKHLGHRVGIKGGFLKENSRIVVESAYQQWTLGERRWRETPTSKN